MASLEFRGNQARLAGLTPQSIGAEDRGAAASVASEAKAYIDGELAKQAALITNLNQQLSAANARINELSKQGVVFRNNVSLAHTGTLVETIIYTGSFPADCFKDNSIFELYLLFGAITNNANIKSVTLYLGGILIGNFNLAGRSAFQIRKIFANRNSKSSQVGLPNSSAGETAALAGNAPVYAMNTNNVLEFNISITLAVSTDRIALDLVLGRIG